MPAAERQGSLRPADAGARLLRPPRTEASAPAVGVGELSLGRDRLGAAATWQEESQTSPRMSLPESRSMDNLPRRSRISDMLGQLAFEMLEGRLPFDIHRPSEVHKKADSGTTRKRRRLASGSTRITHLRRSSSRACCGAIRPSGGPRSRICRKRLLTLEDENRALAKRTFDGLDGFQLKNNQEFFESFYTEFFTRAPLARDQFRNPADQPQKLMDSMIAILNYRASNEPTSLRGVVNSHRHLGIAPGDVDHFCDAFLETLKKKLPRRMAAGGAREKILRAWVDLFAPVVEYIQGGTGPARGGARGTGCIFYAAPINLSALNRLRSGPRSRRSVRVRRRPAFSGSDRHATACHRAHRGRWRRRVGPRIVQISDFRTEPCQSRKEHRLGDAGDRQLAAKCGLALSGNDDSGQALLDRTDRFDAGDTPSVDGKLSALCRQPRRVTRRIDGAWEVRYSVRRRAPHRRQ